MRWNLDKLGFLYQPEYFLGSFDEPKMQERHEKELKQSLDNLKKSVSEETDPLEAMNILNPKDHIQFLENNFEAFRNNNKLEEAVVTIYCANNTPFSSHGDPEFWNNLFKECDESQLKSCGLPLPPDVKKVYRGSITGKKGGLVWTTEKEVVDRIAESWEYPSSGEVTLFEIAVAPENILLYLEKPVRKRIEKLVILSPVFLQSAEIEPYNG